MPSLKCTFREFIAIIESFGFVVVRTKGSLCAQKEAIANIKQR